MNYADSAQEEERTAWRIDREERAVRIIIDGVVYDGGATASVVGGAVPTAGYYVGGVVPAEKYYGWIAEADVREFIHAHRAFLSVGRRYVGAWKDTATGIIWLDVTEWFATKDRATALNIAAGRGELAVWDILNSVEIRAEGNPS